MDYMPQFGQNIPNQDIGTQDDLTAQLLLKRRLAQADALRQAEAPQGQMVSGHYVAPSWTQQLANLYGKYQAGQQEQQAMQDYGQFQKGRSQQMGEILADLGKPGTDTNSIIQRMTALNPDFGAKIAEGRISARLTPKQPTKLGANESLVLEQPGGEFKSVYTNVVEKPETLTTLGKLQRERASITDPNDPRAKQLDAAIYKETNFAPSPSMTVNMPRVETSARINANEDFTKNVYRPTLDQAKRNTNTLAQLDVLDKLPISAETGWSKEAQAKAANVLIGLGYTGKQAQELASNAQTFNAIRGKQTWEMLGAQKGPQTEGDAQRAQATYAQLGNTPEANKFINSFQRAVIKRQQAEAKFYNQHYNEALAAGDLSQLERSWLNTPQAQMSIFDMPEMKQFANMTSGGGGVDYHSKYGLTPKPASNQRNR